MNAIIQLSKYRFDIRFFIAWDNKLCSLFIFLAVSSDPASLPDTLTITVDVTEFRRISHYAGIIGRAAALFQV